MKTIFKYELGDTIEFEIEMPQGARPLYIAVQHGTPYMWASVDTDMPATRFRFFDHGTGEPLHPDVGEYIGSYMLEDGAEVWHVFQAR